MTIHFISIQKSEDSFYDVVQISFPSRHALQPSSSSKITITSLPDQKTAEIAAKQLANQNNCYYVPENTNVITSIPFSECGFLAIELSVEGQVLNFSHVIDGRSSLQKASEIAKKRDLPLILPE